MGVAQAPSLMMLASARLLLGRLQRGRLPGYCCGGVRCSFLGTSLSEASHGGGVRWRTPARVQEREVYASAALSGIAGGGDVSIDSRSAGTAHHGQGNLVRESLQAALVTESRVDAIDGESDAGLYESNEEVALAVEDKEGKGIKGFFPKRGQEVELFCESLAYTGKGVCKVEGTGFVIMCEKALPGERLVAKIINKKRGMAEAYKLRTLAAHDGAVPAPCPHFTEGCGGCKIQNLSYEHQLRAKESQVADLVARVGRFGESGPSSPSGEYMRPIVPCTEQYHYRNKMEFSFGTRVWTPAESYERAPPVEPGVPRTRAKEAPGGGFALGLHAPRRFDKVLPIKSCLLQHDVANQVLSLVDAYCRQHADEIPPYDVILHEGFLRHLTIRRGRDMETGQPQFMVSFLTKHDRPELLQPLADQIVRAHPEVVSILNPVNDSVGNVSVGVSENVLFGRRTITETLRGLQFDISVASFFQTNTTQAEVLYSLVEEACGLKGDGSEVLLDLFCGTGTIGLSMAKRAKHVYGYEIVPEAVIDARQNAERNGISNATFVLGDLNKLKEDFGQELPPPDVIITDPNRPGMHAKLLRFIARSGASRVVYVSCNPATCSRDLDILCHGEDGLGGGQYKLVSVQPVDMFPHTPHIECVAVLQRSSHSDALDKVKVE